MVIDMRGGMGNMQSMMRQMQKMQKKVTEEQERLNETEFAGFAPDEMVKVVFTGDHKMKDIVINPEAIDEDDPDMLQDLIVAAVNDAMNKVDSETNKTMGKYTKGMPGM
jgi:DNA-binding YbaB/EbfC family protein